MKTPPPAEVRSRVPIMSIASVAIPLAFVDVGARAEAVMQWLPRAPVIDQQTDGGNFFTHALMLDDDALLMASADTTKDILLASNATASNGSVVWATATHHSRLGTSLLEYVGKVATSIAFGVPPTNETVSTTSAVTTRALRIKELAKLSLRNDSTPVSKNTEQAAVQILGLLPKEIPLPQPTISEDGEIILSWYGPKGRVEMFIDPSLQIVSFGRFDGGFVDGDDIQWDKALPPRTVGLVRRAYL